LSVCRTCPRERAEKSDLPGVLRSLLAASALAETFRVAQVECLGGCPSPCAVALDAPAKWRVRLTRLTPADGADIMSAAAAYLHLPDGYLTDGDLPAALRGRISARSPKRAGVIDPHPSSTSKGEHP
jgi:predicted metal-binding protein